MRLTTSMSPRVPRIWIEVWVSTYDRIRRPVDRYVPNIPPFQGGDNVIQWGALYSAGARYSAGEIAWHNLDPSVVRVWSFFRPSIMRVLTSPPSECGQTHTNPRHTPTASQQHTPTVHENRRDVHDAMCSRRTLPEPRPLTSRPRRSPMPRKM